MYIFMYNIYEAILKIDILDVSTKMGIENIVHFSGKMRFLTNFQK